VTRSSLQALLALSFALSLSAPTLRARQSGEASQSKSSSSERNAGTHDDKPRSIGSPYVELDSWIYPAIERLAALGYVHAEFLGMRPWTRLECSRLVQEAEDEINWSGPSPQQAEQLQMELREEFRTELSALSGGKDRRIRLESAYADLLGIDGTPLNDSYHFGQTIINNFGRPYQEGFNSWDGLSGYATAGRFTLYVRGEYQHAPSASAYLWRCAR
jgi:Capsule assembly protein Wzi